MNQFTDTIKRQTHALWAYLPTIVYAIIMLMAFMVIGYAVALAVKKGFKKADITETYQSFFLTIIRWMFGIIGFLLALNILGFKGIATSILAGGGVTAIVLGFAFRDIGENILAGFFLAFSRPFKLGDLIRSEDLEGRVKSVELRHTHIRTGDGCDIFIPSAQIFAKPLMNYTRDGLRRADFTIGIDYADDAQKAIALLLEAVKSNPEIIDNPSASTKIAGFAPNYIELNISFWINTFKQEEKMAILKTQVMDACRIKLLKENYTLSSNVSTALTMTPLTVNMPSENN